MNKNNAYYVVQLKNCGGASGKSTIRYFDNTTCDIVFIVTVEGTMYEIPSSLINVSGALTLTEDWNPYIVNLDWGTSAPEESIRPIKYMNAVLNKINKSRSKG